MKIIRDDGLELGDISQVSFTPKSQYGAYKGSGTWLAHSNSTGRNQYFVHYDNAHKWLEQRSKNTYPINRLNEFLR